MITVGMNYQVIPGREADFERVFEGVVRVLRADPGHVTTRLYRDCGAASDYLILSEWDSREAFDRFLGSEPFARVTSWGLESVLRGRPKHEVYEHAPARGHGRRPEGERASPGHPERQAS